MNFHQWFLTSCYLIVETIWKSISLERISINGTYLERQCLPLARCLQKLNSTLRQLPRLSQYWYQLVFTIQTHWLIWMLLESMKRNNGVDIAKVIEIFPILTWICFVLSSAWATSLMPCVTLCTENLSRFIYQYNVIHIEMYWSTVTVHVQRFMLQLLLPHTRLLWTGMSSKHCYLL